MSPSVVEEMVARLGLRSPPEPLAGATAAVWGVGDRVLRVGPAARMAVELAAAEAASAVVRVPRVLGQVEVDGQAGVLTERIRGGPAGDLVGCTEEEAQRRGRACGALQLRLATVTSPPLVPPVPSPPDDEPAASLLHLDLHPFNILVDPVGAPAVIDWANAASGPADLDRARTATILTFDPAARRRSGDPRWDALLRGWSEACGWDAIPGSAWRWALRFLLRDLASRCSAAELEPARTALDAGQP